MPNRLANETSPYLLQHADNPVDWYPWGNEALTRAKRENKPILLSIGYAACHWCHVMAHESFEDGATAALMNERFVNIKVDREERPDLDGIYMQAVQAMTGHGGWPMTMFLTPDGVPFYGGTYYPRDDRHGMPSFRRILDVVANAYRLKPDDVARTAASVREMYTAAAAAPTPASLTAASLDNAYEALSRRYDEENGGFDGAPKFPQTMSLDFLLRYSARRGVEHARAIALNSFRRMARGGIYDQIGGGFARYAVDAVWLVPHFEKMLYDNALLIRLGAHLWQATKDAEIRRVTEETIDWACRELRAPDFGFYSSYDADSEGHEGRFYVWSGAEFDAALGNDAPIMRAYWGVTDAGNFEDRTILSIVSDPRTVAARFKVSEADLSETIRRSRDLLYRQRATRVWPGLDDKILASWNGLMVRAIAEAARAFANDTYRQVAVESAEFLFATLVRNERVFRSYKGGEARVAGFLEDYASLGLAALSVYELTFDRTWIERARTVSRAMTTWFWDDDAKTFFDTAADHEALITRPRELPDNAVPSGTSLAAELLARLAELLNDAEAGRRATHIVDSLSATLARYPSAFGHLLGVADMLVNGAVEIAIVGDPASTDFIALERTVAEHYVPSMVLVGGNASSDIALLDGRQMSHGRATAHVCRNYACHAPVTAPDDLARQLESAAARL